MLALDVLLAAATAGRFICLVLLPASALLIGAWCIRRTYLRAAARRWLRTQHAAATADTRPGPIDTTCLHLEALYNAPAATRH